MPSSVPLPLPVWYGIVGLDELLAAGATGGGGGSTTSGAVAPATTAPGAAGSAAASAPASGASLCSRLLCTAANALAFVQSSAAKRSAPAGLPPPELCVVSRVQCVVPPAQSGTGDDVRIGGTGSGSGGDASAGPVMYQPAADGSSAAGAVLGWLLLRAAADVEATGPGALPSGAVSGSALRFAVTTVD
jgi:hypothetical protein